MDSVRITGGKSLKGEVIPQGAKNEALQILSAVLLTEDKVTINNVPDIIDVNKLIEILKNLGVSFSELKSGAYEFSAKSINLDYLKSDEFILYAKSLRGSIMLVGPLLARYNNASIPRPGGDKIGRRRLDTHFVNLEKLGAKLDYDSKNRIYNVKTNGLVGADL
ncbi:MAG TPA: UDP-N-acetylglucosamine 1-carboxyvinyltransferase, partial [Flavobacteriaceae bacterium]|nr:UDP-N-acetylglucosamine 1-carboxyvinyltransferase [Flavobacteriaceae bacterium]